MTKDVLVSISGLHVDIAAQLPDQDEEDVIEVVTPASYYYRNDKHYVVYDEVIEGTSEVIKNKIKITGTDKIEILKTGVSNSHMIFEKNKKNLTYYKTQYGQMLIGVQTKSMDIQFLENKIQVAILYELDVNHEPIADCRIKMNIVSKSNGDFSIEANI